MEVGRGVGAFAGTPSTVAAPCRFRVRAATTFPVTGDRMPDRVCESRDQRSCSLRRLVVTRGRHGQ